MVKHASYHNGQSEQSSGANEKSKLKTSRVQIARENAGDQVAIGFSFKSDWLRIWRKPSRPITECNIGLLSKSHYVAQVDKQSRIFAFSKGLHFYPPPSTFRGRSARSFFEQWLVIASS